jgi:pentatricopeptide repeat protein
MVSIDNLSAGIFDGLGSFSTELIFFALACSVHMVVFGKYKYSWKASGISVLKGKPGSAKNSPRNGTSAGNLSKALQALLKKVESATAREICAQLSCEQNDCKIQELVTTMGIEAEALIVQTAFTFGELETLRQFLLSYNAQGAASPSTQAALLKRLARRGLYLQGLQCIQCVSPQKACLYTSLLEVAIERKDDRHAQQVVEAAKLANINDLSMYNTILKVCVQNGDASQAREVHARMLASGLSPNITTFNYLLEVEVKAFGMDRGFALLKDIRSSGLQPNSATGAILLKSLQKGCKASDVEQILEVVESLGSSCDEGVFSSFCEACVRTGHSDRLVSYLRRRRKEQGRPKVTCPHTIGNIIRAFSSVEDMNNVWATWKEMQQQHIVPTRITLGCMVEAVAINGDPEAAYSLIAEALANPQTKELVNAVIYGSVIKSFSQRKDFDRVWSLQEEMVKHGIQFTQSTFNVLIDACARSGQMQRAEPLLKDMGEQGIEPNVITFSSVIKGYCSENRVDKAFELLEEMKKTSTVVPDEVTYNTLLDGCARYGQFERGLAVLEEMKSVGVPPSNFTLSVLVKLANRSKKPAKAFELCEQICSEFKIRPNMHVYNNLIHACTNYNDFQRSLEVFGQMLGERVRPDGRTYSLLLRSCISARATREAELLLCLATGLTKKSAFVDTKDVHPALVRAVPLSNLALPKEGPRGLPKDVVCDVIDFLSREQKKHSDKSNTEQFFNVMVRELNSVIPGLQVPSKHRGVR